MSKVVDQVRFSTDDLATPIIINFPRPMSQQELDDFEQLIALFIKTQRRISEKGSAT